MDICSKIAGELNAPPFEIRIGPFLAAEFPRRDRMRIGPQATAVAAGVGLGRLELSFVIVGRISPGEAVFDHFFVDESPTEKNPSDFAAVTVDVDDLDPDRLAENLFGEVLFCLSAEGLTLFRGIDPEQAYAVLPIGTVKDGQRVAVGD